MRLGKRLSLFLIQFLRIDFQRVAHPRVDYGGFAILPLAAEAEIVFLVHVAVNVIRGMVFVHRALERLISLVSTYLPALQF